jgi:uncharacterized protein YecT (DUF1311 family)
MGGRRARPRVGYATLILWAGLCSSMAAVAWSAVPDPGGSQESNPDCVNAVSTAQMRQCANARYQSVSVELQAVYQTLRRKLPPDRRMLLQTAQGAWLRYRQSTADLDAKLGADGTLAPLIRVTTLADITEARLNELRQELGQL